MTIRWALLGPGRHAERSVVPAMERAAGNEFVAVVSRDRTRGEACAKAHGIAKVFTTLDEVLRDREIDALYDASPDGLHVPHAIAAAEAAKHILVEKPLALSVDEARSAIGACRKHGVTFGVVFNQRHEAVHQEARRMILAGEIGELKLAHVQIPLRISTPRGAAAPVTWRTDPAMRGGGIAVSIGDHAFDTLAYLAGQQIDAVAALTDATQTHPPNERVVSMLLELSGGATGHAMASFVTPFAKRPFELHGTRGTLVIENSYTYLTGVDGDPTPVLTIVNDTGTKVQRLPASDCFRLEIEQFGRAIEGKGAPMTTAEEGLRALAVGEALYASINSGRLTAVGDPRP